MADYIYHTSIPAALETLSDFVYSLSAKNGYSEKWLQVQPMMREQNQINLCSSSQSEKRGQERGSKPCSTTTEAPGWKFMSTATTEGITQWAANIEWMAFFEPFFPLTKMNTLENKT